MAVILLKYNYPYENKDLINSYSKGFNLDKRIEIVEGNKNDKYAVSDKQNNYLFSLSNADTQIYSEFWGFTGFIFITIAVLLFLYLYVNCTVLFGINILSLKQFSLVTLLIGLVVGLSLLLSFPDLLYWNKLFSSFEYSSNPLLASIGHLAFALFFCWQPIICSFFVPTLAVVVSLRKHSASNAFRCLFSYCFLFFKQPCISFEHSAANTSVQSSIIFVRCTSSVHFHLGHGFGIAFLQNAQLAENSTSSKQINYN